MAVDYIFFASCDLMLMS